MQNFAVKIKIIKRRKDGYRKLKDAISSLSKQQMTNVPVLEDWTVKGIIAHLAAWNWELIVDIERILHHKAAD